MMEMSAGMVPLGLQQLNSNLHDRVKRDGFGIGYPNYIDGLYNIAEEQSTMEIIRLTAEIATIGAVLFISWMASQKYLGSGHGYSQGYPEYISPSIHSSYDSGPSYSSYGPPPIHYETIESYEPESIHYKEYKAPNKPSYYPEPEYKPDYEPVHHKQEYKPKYKPKYEQMHHKPEYKPVQHEPIKSSYYPTPKYSSNSKQKYNTNADQNYKREYHLQPEYIHKEHTQHIKQKPSHTARDPKPGKGFHKPNSYQSNEILDEYGIHENKYAFDYDASTYNEVTNEQENAYDTRHNSIQDYHKQTDYHNKDNDYKRKSKYITVKPKTHPTETTTQYKLLTTTPFRYIISESENVDRIKSGNGIEINNGWKPSFIPSEYIGSVKPGRQTVVITTKPPLKAHGFKKHDTEIPPEKEAYDQFQNQINTFLTHDPYKSNNEKVYQEPGPPYHEFNHDYITDKIDYYDINEDYYEDEYYDDSYSDYEYDGRGAGDLVTSANKERKTGGQDKVPGRKYMNYDPRKTKHEVVKKMSHEIGNDYPNQNSQQEETSTATRKEESKLITDLKQNIHDKDYSDYRPHNSYSNIIYSPPYAKADLLTTDPHKDQLYVQTLNAVIQPENVVKFSGVSINQAGDSMKRTMAIPEGTPVINNHENNVDSDSSKDNNNNDSESDKFVVVTPIGIIKTMDENEYEKLSNGLKLNDIHDFTYNGLNLEQRIYKKIVNEI